MAITTLDDVIAGALPPRMFMKAATPTLVAGRPHSLFYLGGMPAAAAAPSTGLVGAALTSYGGQLPWTNPGSGNSYLARLQAHCTIAGTLMLCDRLWHNSGYTITSTSEQVFTDSVQIPARDANGQNNGVGVQAAVEVVSATGAGTPTLTFKYTNSAGDTDKTATNIIPTVASSAIGAFYPIGLAAGDLGVRRAQSLQLSATWTSGAISLVLYRLLASLELTANQVPNAIDALTSGFPRLYNDTVPFLVFIPSTTTASVLSGNYVVTQG
jgi:hypothetical protein